MSADTEQVLDRMREWRMGPNQKEVLEEWRGIDVEPFMAAHARLRAREFPEKWDELKRRLYDSLSAQGKAVWAEKPGVPAHWDLSEVEQEAVAVGIILCDDCGKRPRAPRRAVCWGCEKAKRRAKGVS